MPAWALAKVEEANATQKHMPATRYLIERTAFVPPTPSADPSDQIPNSTTSWYCPHSPAGNDVSFMFPVINKSVHHQQWPSGYVQTLRWSSLRRNTKPPIGKAKFFEELRKKIKENGFAGRGASRKGRQPARQTIAMTHCIPGGQRHSPVVTAHLRGEIAAEITHQRCWHGKNTWRGSCEAANQVLRLGWNLALPPKCAQRSPAHRPAEGVSRPRRLCLLMFTSMFSSGWADTAPLTVLTDASLPSGKKTPLNAHTAIVSPSHGHPGEHDAVLRQGGAEFCFPCRDLL